MEGFPDVSEEAGSVFEQLSLILTTEPSSIYNLFGLAAAQVYRKLGDYLDVVRSLYSDRILGGLPTSLESKSSSYEKLDSSSFFLRVFDSPLSGEDEVQKAVEYAGILLDSAVDEIVDNVRTLTTNEFSHSIKLKSAEIDTTYTAISLSDLEGYLEEFTRFALTSGSLETIGRKIRYQLQSTTIQIQDKTREEEAFLSTNLLAFLVSSKKLLESLSTTASVSGQIVAGPYSDFTFPDDDIIFEGYSGKTVPDVVILSGVGEAYLTVSANRLPTELGGTTMRVKATAPHAFALEVAVEVQESILRVGTCAGSPILRASGTGATPITPPDPTQMIRDILANFQTWVEAGDYWLSTSGDASVNKWHIVDDLGGTYPMFDIEVTGATSFAGGLSIDYEIWRPTTNLLYDGDANFGPTLLGRRISIDGWGTSEISRVISASTIEISDYLVPIQAVDGLAPTTASYSYTIYEYPVGVSREAIVIDTTDLFDHDVPINTSVRLFDAAGFYTETVLASVSSDHEVLFGDLVAEGIYTALFSYPVQPGDILHFTNSDHVITKVVKFDTLLVSPPIPSTWVDVRASILPPEFSNVTRVFYDDTVGLDFVTEGVEPGHLLVATMGGSVTRSNIEAVSPHALRLTRPIEVDYEGIDYKILRKEDATTSWAVTAGSLASVLEKDNLAATHIDQSTIRTINGTVLTVDPGYPINLSNSWGIITRGGAHGYSHYALVQERLFGSSPEELRDPMVLQQKIGFCITDPSDIGSSIDSTGSSVLISGGGSTSDRIRTPGLDFTGIRFGDLLVITTSDMSGPVELYRYVREWEEGDTLISFFPSVNISTYATAVTAVDLRRSKASNALYETYLVENSILAVRTILYSLVSPDVAPLKSLIAFMGRRKYDRAIDLLVLGDFETLATSTDKGLSYAGRLDEVLLEIAPLMSS